QLQHPASVFLLVQRVSGFVVSLAALSHPPDDLQPALAQAAQRAGVTFAFASLGLVIGLGPSTELAAAVGPQMYGVAQVPVAVPADFGPVHLAAFKAYRGRPRHALQALRIRILRAVAADLAHQPRRQFVARPGQAAEEVM